MSISEKVWKGMSEGSWIRRRMFEEGAILKQCYGEENVFDLSLGNPVMDPPIEFYRELKRLAVPGRGFGAPGYFRISYCVYDRILEGSVAGFRKAAQKFNLC